MKFMYPMRIYAQLLGLITASAVFFQFYVTLPAGVINVNLADPLALLALLTVVLITVLSKKMPKWRIAEFNWMLILFGVLLAFGYLVGWTKIGMTQWALSARLIGWVVLLGYLSAGYLLVTYIGNSGIRHMLEILAATAMVVILWQIVLHFLFSHGFNVQQPAKNFDGFSGNRNAFAFQLLTVLTLSLAYTKSYVHESTNKEGGILSVWRSWVPLGFLLAGIFWTASRAAMLTTVIVLLLAYCRKIPNRRSLFFGVGFAVLLWSIVWILQNYVEMFSFVSSNLNYSFHKIVALLNNLGVGGDHSELHPALVLGTQNPAVQSAISSTDNHILAVQSSISGEDSNQERWAFLSYGLKMWQHSPLIGEGLGVFMANSTKAFGHPTVIHSTPVWILAEFGVIGAAVMGWIFLKLWRYSTKSGPSSDEVPRLAMLLLLVTFIVFSQFHEMLFQRIIWLIGGVLLGVPLNDQHPMQDQGCK